MKKTNSLCGLDATLRISGVDSTLLLIDALHGQHIKVDDSFRYDSHILSLGV